MLNIRPVHFQYNQISGYNNLEQWYVGILAQEIETILPKTIDIIDDRKGKTGLQDLRLFDASEITFTLINAVKELNEKVITLEEEKQDLQLLLQQLIERIEVLEKNKD